MDQQKRTLLAVVLSAGVMFLMLYFNTPPAGTSGHDGGIAPSSSGTAQTGAGLGSPASAWDGGAVASAAVGAVSPASNAGAPQPPVRNISVDRPLVSYVFSSQGGGLVSAELKGTKMREQEEVSWTQALGLVVGKKVPPSPQMNMARPMLGEPIPLAVSIDGATPLPPDIRYEVVEKPEEHKLIFKGVANGWQVTKTFAWVPEGFELAYQVSVTNTGSEARSAELTVHSVRAIDVDREKAGSMFGGVGNQSLAGCSVGDDYSHVNPKDKAKDPLKGPVRFFGVDQQYFVAAIYPLGGAKDGRCTVAATEAERVATASFPVQLKPGQTFTQAFGVFLGPKDSDLLATAPSGANRALERQASTPAAAVLENPHLEKTIDFGFLEVICKVMLAVLKTFHRLVSNWGIAIILLTVAVKIVLTPFTHKQMVSAEQMRALQPKLDVLKKKYPDDREKQQQEQMKIFQEAGVNPFGSCLLLVVQLPVWWALFRTLRNSFEIYREPFFTALWTDLTYKDPTYVLPVLLGVSQLITARMQPQVGMDPAQARMMNIFMPILFTVFLFNYPMGLTLYILTNNVLTVAQQYASRRIIAQGKVKAVRA